MENHHTLFEFGGLLVVTRASEDEPRNVHIARTISLAVELSKSALPETKKTIPQDILQATRREAWSTETGALYHGGVQ